MAQVSAHLHMPMQVPDPELLAKLKQTDPRAYELWLSLIEKRAEHDMWMERAPIAEPVKLARWGQVLGLVVVLAVLVLAAYAVYKGATWLAGVLAAIDVVALAAVFARPGDDRKRGE